VKAENNVEGEDADGQGGLGRGAGGGGGSGRGRGNRFRGGGREDWGMRNQDVSTRDCLSCVSVVLAFLKICCVMAISNW
jgi:hypothetical protein